mmetsp:Transcript_41649/g.114904  ORF Transcript_41649/g.114904 Transcript_41649/m.114904 type:complete len:544 (-) Transcript_41649:262-1893(-)
MPTWTCAVTSTAFAALLSSIITERFPFGFPSDLRSVETPSVLGEPETETPHWRVGHVELAVACTLQGSIFFIMGFFHLLSHWSPRIRRHAWGVLNTTVSIFAAVLCFQTLNFVLGQLTTRFGPEHHAHRFVVTVAVDYAHFILWFLVMHGAIAKVTIWECATKRDDKGAVQVAKSWTTLLAHMTGFAALKAGEQVQELENLSGLGQLAFLGMHVGLLFVLFRVSDFARSIFPVKGEAAEVWEDGAAEAENDVAALSLSLLMVRSIRYGIAGVFQENDMMEIMFVTEGFVQLWVTLLLLAAALFLLVSVALWFARNGAECEKQTTMEFHAHNGVDALSFYLQRWVVIMHISCIMSSAWCLMDSGMWLVMLAFRGAHLSEMGPHSAVQCTTLAVIVSLSSFLMLLVIDKLDRTDSASDETRRVIGSLTKSLGLVVGFSWERSFDCSVDVLTEFLTEEGGFWIPIFAQLGITGALAVVVVPIWRTHILDRLEKEEVQGMSLNASTEGINAGDEVNAAGEGRGKECNGLSNDLGSSGMRPVISNCID